MGINGHLLPRVCKLDGLARSEIRLRHFDVLLFREYRWRSCKLVERKSMKVYIKDIETLLDFFSLIKYLIPISIAS